MQGLDFEKYYEEKIYKNHDIVSKKEVKILWDRFVNLEISKSVPSDLNSLYLLLKDESNPWMNFTKFYRKRQISLGMCEHILSEKQEADVERRISQFTIRDFYSCIDYKKISFSSLEDLISHVETTGKQYQEKLKEKLENREFKFIEKTKKSEEYSYSVIIALVYFLWIGFSIDEIISLKIGENGIPRDKFGKEIRISRDEVLKWVLQVEKLQERVAATGKKIPIEHDGYVFWKGLTKGTVLEILREFNRISEREVSTPSISRSSTFYKVKTKYMLKENLNPAELAEYDSWLKSFN